jgi:hypothetical protein
MPEKSSGREWAPIVAAVAVRMNVSPNEVRAMLWVDFREVLKLYGVKVKQTPTEIEEQIQRIFGHG